MSLLCWCSRHGLDVDMPLKAVGQEHFVTIWLQSSI